MANGSIYPVLSYVDPRGAIDWLVKAFGLTENAVHAGEDGRIMHAELRHGDGVIMLSESGQDTMGTKPGAACLYMAVDDVDGHHDRAVAAGAEVIYPLTDQDYGSREYAARDLEGNTWSFGTYRP